MIRRTTYALLLLAVVTPLIWARVLDGSDRSFEAVLGNISGLALGGLAVWFAVCVRTEPVLTRVVLILLAVVILGMLWGHVKRI